MINVCDLKGLVQKKGEGGVWILALWSVALQAQAMSLSPALQVFLAVRRLPRRLELIVQRKNPPNV